MKNKLITTIIIFSIFIGKGISSDSSKFLSNLKINEQTNYCVNVGGSSEGIGIKIEFLVPNTHIGLQIGNTFLILPIPTVSSILGVDKNNSNINIHYNTAINLHLNNDIKSSYFSLQYTNMKSYLQGEYNNEYQHFLNPTIVFCKNRILLGAGVAINITKEDKTHKTNNYLLDLAGHEQESRISPTLSISMRFN